MSLGAGPGDPPSPKGACLVIKRGMIGVVACRAKPVIWPCFPSAPCRQTPLYYFTVSTGTSARCTAAFQTLPSPISLKPVSHPLPIPIRSPRFQDRRSQPVSFANVDRESIFKDVLRAFPKGLLSCWVTRLPLIFKPDIRN